MQSDPETRKQIVWQIERKMVEDVVRPVIYRNLNQIRRESG
jgi:hypothetical protein